MSKKSFKQAVIDQSETHQLSAAQLRRLQQLVSVPAEDRRTLQRPRRLWLGIASLALLMLASLLLLQFTDRSPLQDPLTRIAAEVVDNHIHLKPLEVSTDSMDSIRAYFSELRFVPVESQLLADTGLGLAGGRYCSIQGHPAAQLRLQAGADQPVQSLYQAEYDPQAYPELPVLEKGEPPVVAYSSGLGVQIWVEKGILFALTQQP